MRPVLRASLHIGGHSTRIVVRFHNDQPRTEYGKKGENGVRPFRMDDATAHAFVHSGGRRCNTAHGLLLWRNTPAAQKRNCSLAAWIRDDGTFTEITDSHSLVLLSYESEGTGWEKRLILELALKVPGSSSYPEVRALESSFPFSYVSFGSYCSLACDTIPL